MKKLFLLMSLSVVIILSFNTVVTAVVPDIEWEKCYGGINSDIGISVLPTSDGGYAVAGSTTSVGYGAYDYWVVKLNVTGNIEWSNSFGGTDGDVSASIIQTSDGGYAVAGWTRSNDNDVLGNHGNADFWVIKIDVAGNLVWQKCYGGSDDDYANSIIQTSDGGYLIDGSTDSEDGDVLGNHGNADFWVIKIDVAGNLVWQKCYGGSATDILSSVQAVSDGYIIAGYTCSNDGDVLGNHGFLSDYWIIKIDASGNLQWQKCYGGFDNDMVSAITLASDGGYIIAGATYSNDGDVSGNHGFLDYWIIKINISGNLVWQKCYGGSCDEFPNAIVQSYDGGYLITGRESSNNGQVSGNHGFDDFWIIKTNYLGILEWQKCLGGSNREVPASTWNTSDGGLIIVGWTSSVDGDISNNYGEEDCWVVKFPSLSLIIAEKIKPIEIKVYPNPFSNQFNIDLEDKTADICLLDLYGKTILKLTGTGKIIIAPDVSPGIYFLQLTFSDHSEKVIKIIFK